AFVILMFALFAILGFRIARNARTPFLQLTAIGITTTIVLTAFLHIGVVIGLLPTTGLTLPFISYGRSNLVLSMLMTGILVNIGSTREKVIGGRARDPYFVVEGAEGCAFSSPVEALAATYIPGSRLPAQCAGSSLAPSRTLWGRCVV